jgi:ParB/RepB/Spo0J family partition protein
VSTKGDSALQFGFELIDTSRIDANPNNPRGPNVEERDPAFEYLRQSIHDMGILVPLVVKRAGNRFLLIDGERRFHAARSLRMETLPAYVVERDVDEAAVQGLMFHIHMNRLPWKPAQELKASEPLYQRLVQQFQADSSVLLDAYVRETGMNRRTARNRLQFHRWPTDIKQRIYADREDDYWYVIEIEDKIVEPAQRNYPEYFETVPVDDVRRFLFEKLEEGLVKAAVEVREASIITQSKVDGPERKEVVGIINRLVRERDFTFGQARDAFLNIFPDAAEPPPLGPVAALNAIRRLAATLEAYSAEYFTSQPYPRGVEASELRDALSDLGEAIEAILKELE